MINEKTLNRIKRIRAYEGVPWPEVAERTGVPQTSAYYAVMGRPQSVADRQRKELRKRAGTIRMLRKRVDYLERELKRRADQG